MDKLTFKLAGSSLLLLLVSAAAAWGLFRLMLRPIPLLADVMQRLSRNEGGVDVPYGKKADEVGEMARAVQVFKDNMVERECERLAEELSSSISEISRQVAQSSEMASNAVIQATDTNTKIQGLAEAAQKIGEVVELITDIADQTNLLALNATIEATSAGRDPTGPLPQSRILPWGAAGGGAGR